MAQSPSKRGKNEPEPRPIIIKKIIADGHGGHHGGAWKVAYADFVTAMMAFFLLMWILGATTEKMHQGHHGGNHPVKDHTTGKVEIVSMNHGFAVASTSLPEGVEETHISLFDGSNCGLRLTGKPVFSVQHHPEASPGPQDSHYLFRRFINMVREKKGEPALAER